MFQSGGLWLDPHFTLSICLWARHWTLTCSQTSPAPRTLNLHLNSHLVLWPGVDFSSENLQLIITSPEHQSRPVLAVTPPVGDRCRATLDHWPTGHQKPLEMLPQISLQHWPGSSWQALAWCSNDLQIGARWYTCVRTMPQAYCRNSRTEREREGGRGWKRAGGFSLSCQTEVWPLDCVTSRPPRPPSPTDHKWRMWRANVGRKEGGGCRGALQLKRLSSCKLKRHYLLTWRCPRRGRTLWCENRKSGKERKDQRGEKKKKKKTEEWIVPSTGNSVDKKNLCWHGFETLSAVSLRLRNNKWCTFDIMKISSAIFIRGSWAVFLIQDWKPTRNYNKCKNNRTQSWLNYCGCLGRRNKNQLSDLKQIQGPRKFPLPEFISLIFEKK